MKLITEKQATTLSLGDIIKKYPYNGAPESIFDGQRRNYIETYEVRSVNNDSQVVELVMAGDSFLVNATPSQVGRVFIRSQNLTADKTWWVDDSTAT